MCRCQASERGVDEMEHIDFVVLLNKIPPEGLECSYEIANPAAAGIELAVALEGPILADFEIQRLGNEIQVAGTVRATARLQCSRCLAPFSHPVAGEVDATFAPPAKLAEGDHQHELAPDELEVEPLVGGGADLRGVIAEQIHLNLPLKPLCREDCPGICPHCGRPGADGPCECAPAAADPRWEALRKLKVP
jgi:uncharacterized protein